MEFFYSDTDITFEIPLSDGTKSVTKIKGITDKPTLDTIYVATGACFYVFRGMGEACKHLTRIGNSINKQAIFNHPKFPKIVNDGYYDKMIEEYDYSHEKHIPCDNSKWQPYTPKPNEKMLVINGMGTGLGDGLVGLQAVRILEHLTGCKPTLASVSIIHDKDHKQMYNSNGHEQIVLPITLRELMEYDSVVDFSALSIKDEFNTMNFIDFYLKNFGIDPTTVSEHLKSNQLGKANTMEPKMGELFKGLKDKKKRIIGLKTFSSTPIRSLPREKIVECIKDILKENKHNHVFLFDNDLDFPNKALLTPDEQKKFHVISGLDYCQLVHFISNLDALVTVDTCYYHIANAFDIPTLVLFSTIDPKLRTTYYKNCIPIILSHDKGLKGKHLSLDQKEHKYHFDQVRHFRLKKYLNQLKIITLPRKDMTR